MNLLEQKKMKSKTRSYYKMVYSCPQCKIEKTELESNYSQVCEYCGWMGFGSHRESKLITEEISFFEKLINWVLNKGK